MCFFNVLSSAIFLLWIILSVPIAFDVGGRKCGLAFSLSIFYYYLFYSIIQSVTADSSRVRWFLSRVVGISQWILMPGLLIWSLNRFAIDANGAGDLGNSNLDSTQAPAPSPKGGTLGHDRMLETFTIGAWEKLLICSTAVFQLVEGFCSLLLIQSCGQISRRLVNRGRSDTIMIALLVVSASIISSSAYFVWRVTTFPIGNMDAALILATITCAVLLCAWGIGSGRGDPVESSLLFAYVVLCIYQIFTDYLPSPKATLVEAQPDFPPLPPIIMASWTTFTHLLSTLPSAVHSSVTFIYAAFQTITPSVIISLAYRILVFYAATRIIPAIRQSGASVLSREPTFEDSDEAGIFLSLLNWFSPSILVAVYTSLLMQRFSTTSTEGSAKQWSYSGGAEIVEWTNIAATLGLYAMELYLGNEGVEMTLKDHWKTD